MIHSRRDVTEACLSHREKDTAILEKKLQYFPGVNTKKTEQHSYGPVLLKGKPNENSVSQYSGSQAHNVSLSLESFHVKKNDLPDERIIHISSGRNLNAEDEYSTNILININLTRASPQLLAAGDTIKLESLNKHQEVEAHIVGVFMPSTTFNQGAIMAPDTLASKLLIPSNMSTLFYLDVDPATSDQVLYTITLLSPQATFVNAASIIDLTEKYFNSAVALLVSLAALMLLAALSMIMNAVALAMLERRREIGIFKALGYTGKHIAYIILLENSFVAMIGSLLATLPTTLVVNLLDTYAFHASFSLPWFIIPSLIGGTIIVVIITVIITIWKSIQKSPLEVLRYD
ncbi:ABC transporter permease [Dictyobacter vulcani]|uniref:ABC transporter permease n=1 Tax=Dictyobacter vulcani TaxID=2607529 RepID=UPI0013870BE3|nr:ABC transporter permease [Dictyobacter vulcani]